MTDTARHDALVQSDERARHAAQEVFDRPLLLAAGALLALTGFGEMRGTGDLAQRLAVFVRDPERDRVHDDAQLRGLLGGANRLGPA